MHKVSDILSSNSPLESSDSKGSSVCVGCIIRLTESGQAIVDFPGNQNEPLIARSTLDKNSNELNNLNVLLVFENGDPSLPIIIGLVHDELYSGIKNSNNLNEKKITEVFSGGERLVFEAKKEVVLRCGQGSITLRSDGKVVVKGTQLVSRSSGTNKIKGMTVNIN